MKFTFKGAFDDDAADFVWNILDLDLNWNAHDII